MSRKYIREVVIGTLLGAIVVSSGVVLTHAYICDSIDAGVVAKLEGKTVDRHFICSAIDKDMTLHTQVTAVVGDYLVIELPHPDKDWEWTVTAYNYQILKQLENKNEPQKFLFAVIRKHKTKIQLQYKQGETTDKTMTVWVDIK